MNVSSVFRTWKIGTPAIRTYTAVRIETRGHSINKLRTPVKKQKPAYCRPVRPIRVKSVVVSYKNGCVYKIYMYVRVRRAYRYVCFFSRSSKTSSIHLESEPLAQVSRRAAGVQGGRGCDLSIRRLRECSELECAYWRAATGASDRSELP